MTRAERQSGTRQDLLNRLKTVGPSDAGALAETLGITAMAVRQHLYDLQAEGFVDTKSEPRPVGRPAKLWFLTQTADKFFPDAHADLAVGLIETLRDSLGEAALNKLIEERSRRQTELYRSAMEDAPDLKKKLEVLVAIRTKEGYMAAVEEAEGDLLFVENHCPICSAAKVCTGLCAMELAVFQDALGSSYRVERQDHILAGARRCAYRITVAASQV